MFDDDGEMICWFDTENQAEAIGIPEGVLDEFMFSIAGPIAITERVYASVGRVKAVIIKDFGMGVSLGLTIDPLERLQDFVRRFGLTYISRPRSGRSLDFNGGRYYSPEHGRQAH